MNINELILPNEEAKYKCLDCGHKGKSKLYSMLNLFDDNLVFCEECGSRRVKSDSLQRIETVIRQYNTNYYELGIDLDKVLLIMARKNITVHDISKECDIDINELNRILEYMEVPSNECIEKLNNFINKYK